MKIKLLMLFFIAWGGTLFCGGNIAGKWCSVNRNSEGFGTVMKFEKGGAMSMMYAVISEYNYKVKDDSLVFTFIPYSKDQQAAVNTVPYKFSNDTLYFFPNDTSRIQKLVKSENGRNKKDRFYGTWKFKHQKGYDATWQFTSKGIAQINIYTSKDEGKYKLKKDNLLINFKNKPAEDPKIKINGNEMELTSKKKNRTEKFKRLEP